MVRRHQNSDRGFLARSQDRLTERHTAPGLLAPYLLTVLLLSTSLPRAVAQTAPTQAPEPSQTGNPGVQPSPTPSLAPSQPQKPKKPEKPAPKTNPDEFPPNPLEATTPDPLLPGTAATRPLTAAERKQLAIALDGLNAQAAATLKQGDRPGAFAIWYRELRLRRVLGPVEEVTALGRVGDTAWRENLSPDVRWITKRLDAILKQTDPTLPTSEALGSGVVNSNVPTDTTAPASATPSPASPGRSLLANRRSSTTSTTPVNNGTTDPTAVLDALGLAYQQVRLPQIAVGIYQKILTDAKQRHDEEKVDATLITLGQLNLSWFDYPSAIATYQELWQRARARGDQPNEIIYLTQLAYISEQAKQPAQAIKYQQQLVTLYQKLPDPKPIPALKIKIADNYQLRAQLDQAEQNYQSAYQLAQPLLQFAYASEALQKLGALYRANDRPDAALKVFDYLVSLEQQSYNLYGMMSAYDQIGQIQLGRKQNQQALAAFQKGLVLAKQLKYRQDYFTAQIQKINTQSSK